jgi:nucleotide-binding universal stress UspA family protein
MSDSAAQGARDPRGRVVVGVDGSPSSDEALRWAVRHARLTGSPVDAVIAWDFPLAYGVAPGNDGEDFHADAADALDKSVQNVVGAEDAGRVSRLVLRGHPARVLLDASAGADLLVVGCRGHGGFTGMLLGSVSQHVVAHASCPVVVVHGHDQPVGEQA